MPGVSIGDYAVNNEGAPVPMTDQWGDVHKAGSGYAGRFPGEFVARVGHRLLGLSARRHRGARGGEAVVRREVEVGDV